MIGIEINQKVIRVAKIKTVIETERKISTALVHETRIRIDMVAPISRQARIKIVTKNEVIAIKIEATEIKKNVIKTKTETRKSLVRPRKNIRVKTRIEKEIATKIEKKIKKNQVLGIKTVKTAKKTKTSIDTVHLPKIKNGTNIKINLKTRNVLRIKNVRKRRKIKAKRKK